jgi:hypothetical protein
VCSHTVPFNISVAYRDAEKPQQQHGPEFNTVCLVRSIDPNTPRRKGIRIRKTSLINLLCTVPLEDAKGEKREANKEG